MDTSIVAALLGAIASLVAGIITGMLAKRQRDLISEQKKAIISTKAEIGASIGPISIKRTIQERDLPSADLLQAMEEHKGTIKLAEDEVAGKGAVFVIELPLHQQERPT